MTELLHEHLNIVLTAAYELEQYALPLRQAPASVVALLELPGTAAEEKRVRGLVHERLKEEWDAVLRLEAQSDGRTLLRQKCGHTLWQCYRELLTAVESQSSMRSPPDLQAIVSAWFPEVAWSATIEDAFGSLSQALRVGNKSETASMSNLQAVAIRKVETGLFNGAGQPKGIQLEAEDWEGTIVRGLKPSVFKPESAPPCISA